MEYEIKVDTNGDLSATADTVRTITNTANTTTGTINWGYPTYPTYPSNFTYWYPTTTQVFLYQLKCPKCRKMNWCELEKTIECRCGSTLKAVLKRADHEVEVAG